MEVGFKFNNIEIIEKIATGGMGEVFKAIQKVSDLFERLVVVKNIKSIYTDDKLFTNMFFNEARITAKLIHENIVQIYDLNKVNDEYYILMEYIDGKDLFQMGKVAFSKKELVPIPIILRVIEQVCNGLKYAHDFSDATGKPYNIVHRDISLQNIMVTYTGMVKVLDFGVMQTTEFSNPEAVSKVPGKANYMSPELIRGEDADKRSDVFSLGIVFYQMLTGRKPFKHTDINLLMEQILKDDVPPPSTILPSIPKEIDNIILKMLEKDRRNRFQSANELQHELEDYMFKNQLRVSNYTLEKYMRYLFEQ